MKKPIRVFIERGTDGRYGVYMPDDNGLNWGANGEGATIEEAVDDFKAAVNDLRVSFAERGKHFEEVEFNFQYDVPSFLAYYRDKLTLAGLGRITGINQSQLSQYVSGYRNPSSKTAEKIENALHSFGQELSQLNFHYA